MEVFRQILTIVIRYVFPPVIGGLIGLFTNWLALQMLFRPYKAVYIGKFRLPFTPGIIPKRKSSLARAVGKAVAEEIITQKELTEVFSSPKIKDSVFTAIKKLFYEGPTVDQMLKGDVKERLCSVLSEKIVYAVVSSDIEAVIEKCGSAVLTKKGNPFLSFMLSDKLLSVIGTEIGQAVRGYAMENGKALIEPKLNEELNKLTEKRIGELLNDFDLPEEKVDGFLNDLYQKFLTDGLKKILIHADVATVIENKINAMDTKQIADLTFRVMNREMKAVIYLGGLLGALIGVINIFI